MKIEVAKKQAQADGAFNGGEILEKRPVLMSDNGNEFKPYSNLFYWAHAWTEAGSTIGEHPHQGFEILSFVLEGSIEHYDSAHQGWKKLDTGDVQIIRSGSGISHAEKLNAGAHMFQIWFDPDIRQAIGRPASYNDYKSEMFPVKDQNGIRTVTYAGNNAPVEMNSRNVVIQRLEIPEGDHQINVDSASVISVFLINGRILIEENEMNSGDFARISDTEVVRLRSFGDSEVFMIQSPADPGHATYAQMLMNR